LREIFAVLLALILVVFVLYTNDKGKIKSRIDDFTGRKGYQVEMSLDAIKSGGFWGKGIGQGTLKVKTPEIHGDFVFASYAEESGFLGVLFYFILLGVFVWLGFREAWRSRSCFSRILGIAMVMSVAVQTMINIAVVANIIPTTGIPLPFISSGGSSLLMTLVISGLIVNVSKQNYTKGRVIANENGVYYDG
jgi:cell division protein FtsW